jgi:hypothetical protein
LYTWNAPWLKPSPKNARLWEPYLGDASQTAEQLPPRSTGHEPPAA